MTSSDIKDVKPSLVFESYLKAEHADLLNEVVNLPDLSILGMTLRFYWDGRRALTTGSAGFLVNESSGPRDTNLLNLKAVGPAFETLARASVIFVDFTNLDEMIGEFSEEIGLTRGKSCMLNGTLMPSVLTLNAAGYDVWLEGSPVALIAPRPSSNHEAAICLARLCEALDVYRRAWSFDVTDMRQKLWLNLVDPEFEDLRS